MIIFGTYLFLGSLFTIWLNEYHFEEEPITHKNLIEYISYVVTWPMILTMIVWDLILSLDVKRHYHKLLKWVTT